ncbi:MAG: arginine repressor [Acidimicrobiia bacterium]|nr:arginine repressor [Acidimicrobiia bacterium]MDH4306565.1 arginine repressor [Acidimicrobiia bacterium]
MSTTAARRRLIRTLISERVIESQQALVELLAAKGHDITQATASRDLAAVGAIKHEHGYVIDDDRHAHATALGHALDEFAESIAASDNIVVIKTPPGAAHLLGAAIDAAGFPGILGTVAGDDTILVVAAANVGGANIADQLERIGDNP